MPEELNFMIGGEAGQGVQSVGLLLTKIFARGDYYAFADQDYESRIRGGHNFFRVRANISPVYAIMEPVDLLLALNKETIDLHREELSPKGVIVFDEEKVQSVDGNSLGLPLAKLAEEKAGNKLMSNTVALGAALGIAGYSPEIMEQVLREYFRGEVGEANARAARAGYEYAQQSFKGDVLPSTDLALPSAMLREW